MLDFAALRKAKLNEYYSDMRRLRVECFYAIAPYSKEIKKPEDLWQLPDEKKEVLTLSRAQAIRQRYIDAGIIKSKDGSERTGNKDNDQHESG